VDTTSIRRLWGATAALVFLALAVVLLWSDRAGAMFDSAVDIVVRTGRKVERDYDVNFVDRSDIPGETDQIGHAMLWGSGMLLTGWLLRRRVPVTLSALLIAAISLGFEFAQPLLSQTRVVEPSDVTANLVGIAIAAVVLGPFLWIWRQVFGDDRSFYTDRFFYGDARFPPEPTRPTQTEHRASPGVDAHQADWHSAEVYSGEPTAEMLLPKD